MKKLLIFFVFILGFAITAGAQSKKTLRTYGVTKRTTTTEIFDENGNSQSYISQIEWYDKNGEWIEKIDYQNDGEIKKREVRIYYKRLLLEESIDLPQEKEWTERTPSYDRRIFIYNKKRQLIEDRDISRKENIKQRREYRYNKYGDVVERKVFDKSDNHKYTDLYSYDKKGLRTSRIRIDENDKVLEIRTYVYE